MSKRNDPKSRLPPRPPEASTRPDSRHLDPTEPWGDDSGAPVVESAHLFPGHVLADRYQIVKLLGSGGMADVYHAWDKELEESLAVKVLHHSIGSRSNMVERFKTEIRLARRVVHPNVCRIYDFGASKDLKFVTMELLPGATLDTHMASHPELDLGSRLTIFREILSGLEAAHQLGIIHRDLKPQNVMVAPDGSPVITDFGIARELDSGNNTTASGEVLGTPAYMAPERMLGGKVDLRSDIYSLGVILFELVTGERPFSGITVFDMARNQLSIDPPPPTSLAPHLPPWLEQVILKLLAKQPEDRFQSVASVMAELPQTGRIKTVLLVDDDSTMLSIVGVHLNQAGISVLTADNGGAGIEMLQDKEPDLLCLDFTMPQMDGFQVATYLRHLGSKVPIFMLTGMQDPQYEKQAARLGIEQFFTKPLDIEAFVNAVSRRLAAL